MKEFERMIIGVFRLKWSGDIVYQLGYGPRRFTELQHAIARARGQSPHAKTLRSALRHLEDQDYIEHVVGADPAVYRLTPRGRSVREKIVETNQWCRDHLMRRGDDTSSE